MERSGIIDPFNMLVTFESGKSFQKTSLEFNYKYCYNDKKSELEMRLFAGTMLKNTSTHPFYAFSASGRSGREQLKLFANLLLNDHGPGTIDKSVLFFEAGLKTGIWDFFEIYFPLLVSDNIDAITGSFKDRIRFVFKIDIFNPISLKSEFSN